MIDKQILAECFKSFLTLLGQVVSKAHTYLNLRVLPALNFCSELQLSTDPTLCATTCSTWVYDRLVH